MNWNIDKVITDKPESDQKPFPAEMKDSFAVLLKSIDSCERFDREIGNIVEEEAPTYYLGQKSAEEVGLIMESRINLILNECKDS